MDLPDRLLQIAACRSTQTQLGWAHPDCEALQEAARLLSGLPAPEPDNGKADAVLADDTPESREG